ncbi:MAG: NTP transferase domain-containing protein [Clostridia bacterium]|nr:NTP transferase domain-containing protein [Clostridia bacterium]
MKIIAIMPIKLNNERLPGKNVMVLGGKPLLQHQLEAVREANVADEIYVYCSNEAVCEYLPQKVEFLKRSQHLDLPTSNFSQIFEAFSNEKPADVYIYVHATAPFISVETIKECVNAVLSGEFDSAFCAVKIQDFLWKDGEPLNFDAMNIPRSQDIEPIYRETSGVYVFTNDVFKAYRRRIGKKPYIKEVSFKEAVDINNPEDFKLAEAMVGIDL